MEKFLIIDGNSIMNRAFYGISASKLLMSSDGIYTNAIYGFLNIYYMVQNKIQPDYTAVTFDLKGDTFRKELFDEYKATRKSMPDELRSQMVIIKDVLRAMNIPIIEQLGVEADDVIGTVSKINEENNIHTYILTGDKDSFQLISDKTYVIYPLNKPGATEYLEYTPSLLKEKYNISPYQVVDIKSLMGDSSDNIPGVKGIGEKTAYSLIEKYTTLDNIYSNIDNLDSTKSVIQKLVDNKEMAYLSYTLATIKRDVEINLDYDHARVSDVHLKETYDIFKKLNFNKFLKKYDFSSIENEVIDNKKESINLNKIPSITYINDLDNSILNKPFISYYLNISNVSYINKTFDYNNDFLSIFDGDKIYIIKLDSNNRFNILDKFASSNMVKYGYNIKQDLRYLFDNNIKNINNFKYDIMIASYLLDSSKTNYNISNIISDLFNVSFKEANSNTQINFFDNEVNQEFLTENEIYNLSIYLLSIFNSYNVIYEKLSKLNLINLFEKIEMPLEETLANMEHTGMYIDLNKLNEFDIELNENIIKLEKQIIEMAGEEFNINSPKQLGEILFNKLNLPVVKKNKSGFSTDKDVLEELIDHHDIIKYILEYRQLTKLKSTYVDGIKSKIDSDGRVHTTFTQTVTTTGRLSSTEPNLQNIPIRLELGSKIRSFFVGEKDNLLIDSDYSQIELRVLAHMSNDTNMIDAFNNGIDIHKATASQVFNVSLEEVTKEMRSNAKAVNFGIVYGISDFGLSRNINIPVKEAKMYIENYLNKYSNVKEFMDNCIKEANEKGYITTMFDRIRYIHELKIQIKI
jgi:DNA polymerase I